MKNILFRFSKEGIPQENDSNPHFPGKQILKIVENSPQTGMLGRLPFRGRFSLRVKLPLVVITLLILAFLAATTLSIQIARAAWVETLQNNLVAQTSLQVELTNSYLIWTKSMAVNMATVAESVDLTEDDALNTLRQALLQNEHIFGSTIAYEPYKFQPDLYYWAPYYSRTGDGKIQFAQLGNPDYNYFQWDWYTLPKNRNEPVLSPPYFDKGGGEIWMVTWSVPFYDQTGVLKGVATADIAFQQTQEFVRQIDLGKQGYAFLIDQEGVVLGIGDNGGQYQIMEQSILLPTSSQQASGWNSMINEMLKGESGFVNVVDPQEKPVFVAYQPIGLNTGWSLGLAFPQAELFQPVAKIQTTLIIFSILIVIVASVVLFFFTQSITSPLQHLASQARLFSQGQVKLSKGQLAESVNIRTNDELEDLGNAFNQMSVELAHAFSTLEEKVTERTKALAISAEVSRRLATILNPRQLAIEVVEQVQTAFNYYHAHIYFLDEVSGDLLMAGGTGEAGAKMLASGHKVPKGRGLVGRATDTNQPILIPDVTQAEGWLPNPLLPETKSEVAIPIASGNTVLGVLDVQQNVVNGLGEEDVTLLQALVSQIAISLQNARSFEQSKSQADLESLVNAIGQKIQRATTVDDTLQTAIREIGLALGATRVSANIGTSRQRDSDIANHN